MSNVSNLRPPLSDETRNNVIKMNKANMSQTDIAAILGISTASTYYIITAYNLVEKEDWDALRKSETINKSQSTIQWALKTLGKEMPKEKKKEVVVEKKQVADLKPLSAPTFNVKQSVLDEVKNVVAEAISENCKGSVEQIDRDQMARIMLALGKITDALAEISLKMEEFQKTANVNADNLYRLVTDFSNGVKMEMRKRK